jgi:hypothetical protein
VGFTLHGNHMTRPMIFNGDMPNNVLWFVSH